MKERESIHVTVSSGERYLAARYRAEIAEYINVAMALGWAVWLLCFNVYDSTPVFARMRALPEAAYALLFLAVGGGQFVALYYGTFKQRRRFAFAAAVLWLVVSFETFTASPYSTAGITLAVNALRSVWIYARLRETRK